uniref:C2H2-type domain-containing protein n=1 Tax=Macrostomum lignano TaxID=282301 RepID=A0A1I8FQ63_9PLAT
EGQNDRHTEESNGSEGGNGGGGLPDAADAALTPHALRQERELLREEAQRAKLAAEGLRCDVEDLEAQMQSESETFRKTMSGLEAQLESERLARLAAEEEAADARPAAGSVASRTNPSSANALAQAEAELDALRRQSAPSCSGLVLALLSHQAKQTALESSNAEKASLRLMVEQLRVLAYPNGPITPRRLPRSRACRPDLRRRPSLDYIRIHMQDPPYARHMKRAVNTLDKAGVKLGVFLRPLSNGPDAIFSLHRPATPPEMHQRGYNDALPQPPGAPALASASPWQRQPSFLIGERFDGNGNLQDPVSAVAVPSFSLMTDCADNLIDSSASSASHQFQENLSSPRRHRHRRVRRRQRRWRRKRELRRRGRHSPAVLTAAPADYDSSANGGNIGIELLLSAGSELVAASAEFCLCANCGLCCQGADRMRAHKTASGHLGFLRADPFDTHSNAPSARISWNPARPCSATSLCTVMRALPEEAPKMTAPPAGAAVAAVPSAPSGPFDCAVCGRGLPAVSDLTAHAAQTGHSQFKAQRRLSRGQEALPAQSKPAEPPAAVGSSRPSPVVTLGPSEQLSVCLQCTAWTAGVVAQNEHGKRTGHYSFQDCSAPERRQRGPTCYKCLLCHQRMSTPGQVASHISRFSHENFASLVDDCSRLADGPPPGQELPYLRVRLCPMRPATLAEESAAADMASRSLQLAVARQNLGLPYSVNLCRVCGLRFSSASPDELLAHARAAHIGERDLMDRKIALMTFITESADSATVGSSACRSSVYLTCLLCPTRLRFASDLPPHLNAAHRRPCPPKPILLPDGQASMRRHLQTVCITRCSLCDRCFPSEAQLRRHRDADHSTTTLPPPVKRRRRSIVDFGAAATQTRDTGDDRLLLCFTCGRRIHQLVGAEVASFGVPPASSWQFCNKLFNFLLFVLAADWLVQWSAVTDTGGQRLQLRLDDRFADFGVLPHQQSLCSFSGEQGLSLIG